ncbi:MAG: type II secretion system F family protein [Actinomycetota bacterium]
MAESSATLARRVLQFEITPKKVKPVQLMNFCRYLSVFVTAGVPLLDALEIIYGDSPDKKLKRAIREVSASLQAGENFSAAVAIHRKAFPGFFVNVLRSAEASGQLDVVLGQLAGYIERDLEARRKTRAALVYPAVVIALACVSGGILVGFVLPRFKEFFAEFDAGLPLPTRILVAVTDFMVQYGLLTALLIGLLSVSLFAATLTGPGRTLRDRAILRMPLVGKVVRFAVVERFCRILSAMVKAGVPLVDALELSADGTSNRAFTTRLARARQSMIEGEGLYLPLAQTSLFPASAIQMIRVGEETGTLDDRLGEIAAFYGQELEHKLKNLTSLLEPIAIVVVGLMVGFVSVALVSAIYGVYSELQ